MWLSPSPLSVSTMMSHPLLPPSCPVSSFLPTLTFERRAFGFTNISQKQSCSGVKTSMREAVRVKFREKGRRWEEVSPALMPQTEQMQLNISCSLKGKTGASLLSLQTRGDNTLFPRVAVSFYSGRNQRKVHFPLRKRRWLIKSPPQNK